MMLRQMSWTASTPIQTLLLLTVLVLGFAPGRCLAQQGVNLPATKNIFIQKVASFYEMLEYEAALKLIPNAESTSKNDAERLWVELMKGVLYYSVNDTKNSDAAFLRALKQSPFTALPLQSPSQTMYEQFEKLRAQVRSPQQSSTQAVPAGDPVLSKEALLRRLSDLEARARKATNGSPPLEYTASFARARKQILDSSGVAERRLALGWVDVLEFMVQARWRAPGASLPYVERTEVEKKLDELYDPSYSRKDFLLKKASLLDTWFRDEDAKGRYCPIQEKELAGVRQALMAETTYLQRLLVAIRMDRLCEAMVRCFGDRFVDYDQLRPQ